MTNIKALKWWW